MTRTSDLKNQQKKIGWSDITPFYFPALMNMAILHNSEPRDRTGYNHFYFEGFMMQQQSDAKIDFYNTI